MFKILSKFQKSKKKNCEKALSFSDNSISIGSVKLSLLRREYLSSPVNVLTNSAKILHILKRNFFELNSLLRNQ